eukprot:951482-Rhodomonas_salina.1
MVHVEAVDWLAQTSRVRCSPLKRCVIPSTARRHASGLHHQCAARRWRFQVASESIVSAAGDRERGAGRISGRES